MKASLRMVLTVFLIAIVGEASFADDMSKMSDKKEMPAMTKDQREKMAKTHEQMAKTHEQMATCLRSTKSLKDCHEEMKKSCMTTMGEKGCPMMGHHGMSKMHDEEKEAY